MGKLLNQLGYKDIQGLKHLDSLVGNKTRIAYSADDFAEKTAIDMTIHAQRFASWAARAAIELSAEGWR